jgi:hypothetical protein
MDPSETDKKMGEEPKLLFHPLKGCNIKLKVKKLAGFPNWDDSNVEGVSSIYASAEEAKEDITNNAHKLQDLMSPESYDTYEELKNRLLYVLECYKPESMDEITFKSTVESTLGSREKSKQSTDKTTEPVEQKIEIDEPIQEKPVQEQRSAPTPSSDLDFLDDL